MIVPGHIDIIEASGVATRASYCFFLDNSMVTASPIGVLLHDGLLGICGWPGCEADGAGLVLALDAIQS